MIMDSNHVATRASSTASSKGQKKRKVACKKPKRNKKTPKPTFSVSGTCTSWFYMCVAMILTYTYTFRKYYYCAKCHTTSSLIMNDGFKIPSPSAKAAVETAEKLLEWCSQTENSEAFGQFTIDLLEELETCFKSCCRSRAEEKKCGIN